MQLFKTQDIWDIFNLRLLFYFSSPINVDFIANLSPQCAIIKIIINIFAILNFCTSLNMQSFVCMV
nr:hypothetical protein [Clostridia bacterium]